MAKVKSVFVCPSVVPDVSLSGLISSYALSALSYGWTQQRDRKSGYFGGQAGDYYEKKLSQFLFVSRVRMSIQNGPPSSSLT